MTDLAARLEGMGATRLRLEVPDVNGILRGKLLPAEKMLGGKGAGVSDVLYCLTSADEVFENPDFSSNDTGWPDVMLVPDWSSLAPVPWERGLAAVVCDVVTKAAEPVPLDPRAAVRVAERRLEDAGYAALCGVEYEFFLFAYDDAGQRALREHRARDLVPVGVGQQAYSLIRWPDVSRFADDLFRDLSAYGVPIDSMSTELGFGMFEVAISPLAPVAAADAAARFKLGCKELARRHGYVASFVAKTDTKQSGSSGHVHVSVRSDGRGGMRDALGRLSEVGARGLAGLAATAVETSVFMAPFPNSYRRYRPGLWTPTNVTWGHDNRNACLRAITVTEAAARIEHRRGGADLHPYLAVAACVDGCRHGLEQGLDPPPEAPGRAFDDARAAAFPTDLSSATEALRRSALVRRWYGDALVDHYALSRDAEHAEWRKAASVLGGDAEAADEVPEWELARYLELV